MQTVRYKYKREDRLNCKLSEDDIKQIRVLYLLGYTQKYLAKKFKVDPTTIYYWTHEDVREKMIKNATDRVKEKQKTTAFNSKRYKKYTDRKKEMLKGNRYFVDTKIGKIQKIISKVERGEFGTKNRVELLLLLNKIVK